MRVEIASHTPPKLGTRWRNTANGLDGVVEQGTDGSILVIYSDGKRHFFNTPAEFHITHERVKPEEEWWLEQRIRQMEEDAAKPDVTELDPIKAEALRNAVEHHRGKAYYTAADIAHSAKEFERYLRGKR